MILKRACKAIGITFILAMIASLSLGCASTDAGKSTGVQKTQSPMPAASTDTGAGKGLYPENRDKGAIKELEREQQEKK